MPRYLIEIRGKDYAADAGKVIASDLLEARDPYAAAYVLARRTLETGRGTRWRSEKEFWNFHYFDWVEI